MTRVKPTEITMVADMLQQPAESADELAEAIIRAIDEKRRSDDAFYLVVWDRVSIGLKTVWVQGPYPTRLQATKAAHKAWAPGGDGKAYIGTRLKEDLVLEDVPRAS